VRPIDLTPSEAAAGMAAAEPSVIAAMEAAPIAAVVAAPIESAATVIARTPVDAATPAIPAISPVIAAAVISAAIIGRAVIPSGIERRDVTGGRVDAGLITTGKRDREHRNDRAQKNPTANHDFPPSPT
jgi:hypothetical protein